MTAGCLFWAVKDIRWQEVQMGFSQARYETIPLYFLFLGLFFWLKAVRWSQLVSPVKNVSAQAVAGPMMVGFMGNNLLPAHLGEVFRVVLLSRQEKIPAAAVFASVAVERLLDVFAVLLLVGIGLLGMREIPAAFEQAFVSAGVVALGGVFCLVIGLIWLDQALWLAQTIIRRLPLSEQKKKQLQELVTAAATGTVALKNGRLLILLLFNSVVQWGCNCVMIYISLRSFGIEVPFSATLILLGALVFAVTIPSTPGFFGMIQLAFVKTLALFSVTQENAFAASIYYHLLQYVAVTAVGLWYLWRSGVSLSRLRHEAETLDPPSPPVVGQSG